MKLRLEYWEKVKDIEPKNLVFLGETGALLGLRRTHARSERGKASLGGKTFLLRGKSHSNWCNYYPGSSGLTHIPQIFKQR
jgi:hypothetical protein